MHLKIVHLNECVPSFLINLFSGLLNLAAFRCFWHLAFTRVYQTLPRISAVPNLFPTSFPQSDRHVVTQVLFRAAVPTCSTNVFSSNYQHVKLLAPLQCAARQKLSLNFPFIDLVQFCCTLSNLPGPFRAYPHHSGTPPPKGPSGGTVDSLQSAAWKL